MKTVYVERQADNSFAVYVGGDDDAEFDQLFSFGIIAGRRVSSDMAKRAALRYARKIAARIGAKIEEVLP
jgi:hypothetical protein